MKQCYSVLVLLLKVKRLCYDADQLYLLLVYISTLRQKLDRTLTGMWVTVRGCVGVDHRVYRCEQRWM